PTRTLARRGRLDHVRVAGLTVDAGDERAGERAPPDVAAGCRADAVGAGAARRFLDRHGAGPGRDLADEAALAGEPEVAVAVERRGVPVRVASYGGQRERAHRAVGPADSNDRVLAAVGEPRGLVRA